MSVQQRFQSFIREKVLFQPHDRILLAVSGGRDSVVMVRLFNEAGYDFGIAHCNFGLRGAESDDDEMFCRNLATDLGVPFESVHFDTASYATVQGVSTQMAARDLRYEWLETTRDNKSYQYIAIAHHQNDVIETVLLNLTRGTGISGLHGIAPKRDKLIRPLLFLTRDEIDQFAKETGMSYREDSSNMSSKYSRNRIRLEVVPALKALNPSLERTFEDNIRRFAELELILAQHVATQREKLFKLLDENVIEIDLNELSKVVPLRTSLYELFRPYGFTEAVLDDLIGAWSGNPGKQFFSATHGILLDRGFLLLTKIQDENSINQLVAENETVQFNGRRFVQKQMDYAEFELLNDPQVLQADFERLLFPLRLRNWLEGDYFYPLGAGGKKKLSDFFINQKVSLNAKKQIPILENGNGEIIWVAGLRMDERYKITERTKKVFIFG